MTARRRNSSKSTASGNQLITPKLVQSQESFVFWLDFKSKLKKSFQLWAQDPQDLIQRYNNACQEFRGDFNLTNLSPHASSREIILEIMKLESNLRTDLKKFEPIADEQATKKEILSILGVIVPGKKKFTKTDNTLKSLTVERLIKLVQENLTTDEQDPNTPIQKVFQSMIQAARLSELQKGMLKEICEGYIFAASKVTNIQACLKALMPFQNLSAFEDFYNNYVMPAAEIHVRESFGEKKPFVVFTGKDAPPYARDNWDGTSGYYVSFGLLPATLKHIQAISNKDTGIPSCATEAIKTAIAITEQITDSQMGDYYYALGWNSYDGYDSAVRQRDARSIHQLLQDWESKPNTGKISETSQLNLNNISESVAGHFRYMIKKNMRELISTLPVPEMKLETESIKYYCDMIDRFNPKGDNLARQMEIFLGTYRNVIHCKSNEAQEKVDIAFTKMKEVGAGILEIMGYISQNAQTNENIYLGNILGIMRQYEEERAPKSSRKILAANYVLEAVLAIAPRDIAHHQPEPSPKTHVPGARTRKPGSTGVQHAAPSA